jgi:hypothetical protein
VPPEADLGTLVASLEAPPANACTCHLPTRPLISNASMYSRDQFMNPGPAPRPPPRLNLTPNTSSTLPGNMAGLSLQSPAYANSSQVSLMRTQTEKTASSTTTVKEGTVKILEESSLSVFKADFLSKWVDRWLVLREFDLSVFKSVNNTKPAYSIPLREILGVERSDQYALSFEIKRSTQTNKGSSPPRDGPTKLIICKLETESDMYTWIDSIYQRCPSMGGVSNPTNFTHRVHVGFDPTSGAFVGLPVEWEKLLTASALTKDDYAKNPKAVLEVLEFYAEKLVKRSEDPHQYSSLTPTPPVSAGMEKQLGYGGGGNSVAPPRPAPPGAYQRKDSYSLGRQNTPPQAGYPNSQNVATQNDLFGQERRRQEEQARMQRDRETQRQRQEYERREREELAAYNASLPQRKLPIAQQEVGGGVAYDSREPSPSSQQRYNPSRPAPSTPGAQRAQQQPQQPPGSLRQMAAQRPAPSAPNSSSKNQGIQQQRPPVQPSASYKGSSNQVPQDRAANGQTQQQQYQGSSAAPKPLNVAKPAAPANDAVKKAEQALTSKPKEETPRKDVRMSSMSESEVMAKLREVVSKEKPLDSYNKQKKIGQGASGSVYVARIRESATSPTARRVMQENGPRAQVAIKQMDLRNQPRKELIVNEIIVMKDSKHPNIVNFLDAFLQEEQFELWVVMEFMEGGALTDVIDNNPSISEDQIATISFEVSSSKFLRSSKLTPNRLARVWSICTTRTSSTATSRVTMFCSTVEAMSRLVCLTISLSKQFH